MARGLPVEKFDFCAKVGILMHKHIYELVNTGLEHFIIIIQNKIQFHTFSLTHFWHTSGKMLILEQNFELIKL